MNKRALRAPRFAVTLVECFERPVTLRLPFRFGAATVDEAPQAFVQATIRATDGRVASGVAADMMIPKWFDKSPDRSNEQNVDDLRVSLILAGEAYTSNSAPRSAFGHASFHYRALLDHGGARGLNALTASYGAALVDRAVLDALCRMRGVSIGTGLWLNLPGLGADLTPDLAHFDFDAFLSTLPALTSINARHTVGMMDPLIADDVDEAAPDDGLPVALTDVASRYGNRYFKLKLRGDVAADMARLVRIASVLEPLGDYRITLDGNEQFADMHALDAFHDALLAEPRLGRLREATLYVEQPLPRAIALEADVHAFARSMPLIIDESDATIDAFPQARAQGYAGVSSKSCKGFYKSLLNAARCVRWNAGFAALPAFMTGEDLTAQPGIALQQDLALAGLIGLAHVERNGHHYATGFAGQRASVEEQQAFLTAHPDLYEAFGAGARLRIRDGRIALGSLGAAGLASAAWPDLATMEPIRVAGAPGRSSDTTTLAGIRP
ncbi:MAG TPA: mandelate racemase [Casimicrobiaceae bacterium]|nr:mandelate racemase [Casimicrobiaceae bacterium]